MSSRATFFCWIATAVCMTGTFVNVYRLDSCFIFWIVGEVMWTAFDVRQRLWSRTMLDALGLAFAVLGAIRNFGQGGSMSDSERMAFEEIYKFNLNGTGKRERNTRRICEAMLGTRAAVIKAEWIASKPSPQ